MRNTRRAHKNNDANDDIDIKGNSRRLERVRSKKVQRGNPLQQVKHPNRKDKKQRTPVQYVPINDNINNTVSGAKPVEIDSDEERNKQTAKNGDNIWWCRCRQLMLCCLENDHTDVATWHSKEVLDMVDYWEPHQFAAAFADSDPERLASLLKECPLSFASSACQTWPHDQLAEVLPLLSTKVARQILRSLYFESEDPYLTRKETRAVLMAFPPEQREKLCSKLLHSKVEKVLGTDFGTDDWTEDGRQFNSTWSDSHDEEDSDDCDGSYESSFVVDDDEVEEGEQGISDEEEEYNYDDDSSDSCSDMDVAEIGARRREANHDMNKYDRGDVVSDKCFKRDDVSAGCDHVILAHQIGGQHRITKTLIRGDGSKAGSKRALVIGKAHPGSENNYSNSCKKGARKVTAANNKHNKRQLVTDQV